MPSYEKVVILSGGSRGLGAALLQQLLQPSVLLVHITRASQPQWQALAHTQQAGYQEWIADLSAPPCQADWQQQMQSLPKDAASYWLINNAGTVEPIAQVAAIDSLPMQAAFMINTLAPIALCQAFVAQFAHMDGDRKILNISSGAGRSPVAGWGVYCATKAALDRFSEVLQTEQGSAGIRVASLAPGVIDTQMQTTIRQQPEAAFPSVERFQALHQQQQLSHPDAVAEKILRYLAHPSFGVRVLDDIREFQ